MRVYRRVLLLFLRFATVYHYSRTLAVRNILDVYCSASTTHHTEAKYAATLHIHTHIELRLAHLDHLDIAALIRQHRPDKYPFQQPAQTKLSARDDLTGSEIRLTSATQTASGPQ